MVKDQDLEKFAQELQEQIMQQIKKRYSETVIEHWQNPRNFKKIDQSDVHCAQLAAETLRRALADYLYQKGSSWKKHYRKS